MTCRQWRLYQCQFLLSVIIPWLYNRTSLFRGNVQGYLGIEGPHVCNLLSEGSEKGVRVCVWGVENDKCAQVLTFGEAR